MSVRLHIGLGIAIGFAATCGAGTWVALDQVYRGEPASHVAAGPLFGFEIGRSTPGEVRARAAQLGLSCADRSMSVIMAEARAHARAARAAKGADAVSNASASTGRRSHPVNPQVRLSCDDTPAGRLDRRLGGGSGRLLFVFDAADRPLRHMSFQRTHRDEGQAWADFESAEHLFADRFGAPSLIDGPRVDGRFTRLDPVSRGWSGDDLEVKVSALPLANRVVVSWQVARPYPPRVAGLAREGGPRPAR